MKLRTFLADSFRPQKGSIKIEQKGAIEDYRSKYERLVGDNPTRLFRHTTYLATPGDVVTVHVLTPSNSLPDFKYDVLLQFTPTDNALTYEDCNIRVFSNSPGFVFSYAYTFAHWDLFQTKNRMLIPGTERKLGKLAVTRPPNFRNPLGIPHFDESIYFAIFYLLDNVDYPEVIGTKNRRSLSSILTEVRTFDKIQIDRKAAENKKKADKKADAQEKKQAFDAQEKGLRKANRIPHVQRPQQMKTMDSPKSSRVKSAKSPSGFRKPKGF